MILSERELLHENDEWGIVLRAYRDAEEQALAAEPEATPAATEEPSQEPSAVIETSAAEPESPDEEVSTDESSLDEEDTGKTSGRSRKMRKPRPWITRLVQVETISPEDLSHIHGQLIAHGLLKFELQSRHDGLAYQVTNLGRKLLNATDATVEDAA